MKRVLQHIHSEALGILYAVLTQINNRGNPGSAAECRHAVKRAQKGIGNPMPNVNSRLYCLASSVVITPSTRVHDVIAQMPAMTAGVVFSNCSKIGPAESRNV